MFDQDFNLAKEAIIAFSIFGYRCTEPKIAGSIFINRHNRTIDKSLPGCKMLKGFPIVIIKTESLVANQRFPFLSFNLPEPDL